MEIKSKNTEAAIDNSSLPLGQILLNQNRKNILFIEDLLRIFA